MTSPDPDELFDRELNWIAFNGRVLQEAQDHSIRDPAEIIRAWVMQRVREASGSATRRSSSPGPTKGGGIVNVRLLRELTVPTRNLEPP